MAGKTSPDALRREMTVEDYYHGVRAGNVAILARAITLVESNTPRHQRLAEELLTRLLPHCGQSLRVGVTGVPGVGKSTFIEALGMNLIRSGKRVVVLAVDPSSGISGGSILGDKTRMAELSAEPKAFIRPSPSAGTLGGVARRTRESLLVCEAAGYQIALIETVGVGQSETMVADMTDCFLALMLPGAGDELQGIKRGLLELVDIIAVNKADGEMRPAAERAAHQYEAALNSLSGRSPDQALPVVLTCSALQREGIDEVWQAIARHHARKLNDGSLMKRRGRQNLRWMWSQVEQQLQSTIRKHEAVVEMRDDLERDVLAGVVPPEVAARKLIGALRLDRF